MATFPASTNWWIKGDAVDIVADSPNPATISTASPLIHQLVLAGRPLSVLQVRANVRAKYARISQRILKAMLSPMCKFYQCNNLPTSYTCLLYRTLPDGSLVAKHPNCAVSESLLKEIWGWRLSGASDTDVLSRLRVRTVPQGYFFLWYIYIMPIKAFLSLYVHV